MKIKPNAPAAPATKPQSATPPVGQPPEAPTAKGWQASAGRRPSVQSTPPTPPSEATARQAVTQLATAAVSQVLLSQPAGNVDGTHPLLERFGKDLGLGLGVLVTEALAAVPSWNTPVLDAGGKPVASVEGAERIGNHDILKRHQEVLGPKIAALVAKLAPGAVHDLLDGLAKGASAAPGTSYRLEAKLADLLHR